VAEEVRLSLLQRRRIEAGVLGPFIRTLEEELGRERARTLALKAIARIARDQGRDLAQRSGGQDLTAFARALREWVLNSGDLEVEMVEESPTRLAFNVRRCRFAEMYREMGLGDLGAVLSCGRDFALSEGFNPRIRLERTQTLMEGAPFCDFRFRLEEGEG